jgi:tetratricopeptide (TPR) repeat protein
LSGLIKKSIYRIFLPAFLIIVLILFSFKTVSRNNAWKDDFTLFTTDVRISSNSAKSNCSAGGTLVEAAQKINNKGKKNKYLTSSIKYLNKAIEIYPEYVDALRLLGNAHYFLNKNIDTSIYYYKQVLLRNPYDEITYKNIGAILNTYNNIDHKISIYNEILQINPNRFDINYNLGNLYGKYINNIPKALKYLKMAASINPENKKVCKDLGVAYGISGQLNESVKWFEKAITIDPHDYDLYTNLGITYHRMGNIRKANEYFTKAREKKP